MKPAQVNKLYRKLTPHEQAALVFEATVRRDNVEAEAIKASVPIQNFPHFHRDFTHRAIGFLLLTGFYGTIYFQTKALILACNEPAQYLARLASMDTALVNVCDRFKVSVDAIKTQALCLNEPVFSEYAQADLIDQFTELFTDLVI